MSDERAPDSDARRGEGTVEVPFTNARVGDWGSGTRDQGQTQESGWLLLSGKKTSFGDSDEDSADMDSLEKDAHDDLREKIGICIKRDKEECWKNTSYDAIWENSE